MEISSEFQVANFYVSNKLNASLGRCSSGGELQRGGRLTVRGKNS